MVYWHVLCLVLGKVRRVGKYANSSYRCHAWFQGSSKIKIHFLSFPNIEHNPRAPPRFSLLFPQAAAAAAAAGSSSAAAAAAVLPHHPIPLHVQQAYLLLARAAARYIKEGWQKSNNYCMTIVFEQQAHVNVKMQLHMVINPLYM